MNKQNQNESSVNLFDYNSWKAGFILAVLRFACVLGIGLIAISLPNATRSDIILFSVLYFILIVLTFSPLPYPVRAGTLILIVYAIGINSILAWGPWLDGSLFFIAFIILSALLFEGKMDWFALLLSMATFTTIGILQINGVLIITAENLPAITPLDWAAYGINLLLIGGVLIAAINRFKQAFHQVILQTQTMFQTLSTERELLEIKIKERTEELELKTFQLKSATEVASSISEIQDTAALLDLAVKLIAEKFNFRHVGIFLLDERRRIAHLQASSSETGKQQIGYGQRIESDQRNLFYRAVQSNRAVVTSEMEEIRFAQQMPSSEAAVRVVIPMTVRRNSIGILDIQSDRSAMLNSQDTEILKTLADLIGVSLDNSRLMSETRSLIQQLEKNTSFQTRKTWGKFTSKQQPSYQYTPAGVRPIFNPSKEDAGEVLVVPLTLYGQTIGKIKLKRTGEITNWTEREKLLIGKIADQVALALENSRLVDEAQKNSLRDQMIANISARIRETLDMESVIRTATTELRRLFDLKETEIIVGPIRPESTQSANNTISLRLK